VDLIGNLLAMEQELLLFLLRTSAFIVIAPFVSARFSPPQFRIALSVFLSITAWSAWGPGRFPQALPQDASGWGIFVPMALSEVLLGLLLGFFCGLMFAAFQFAGSVAGYQMGFSIVNVLDPHTQQQQSIIGDFLFVCATLAYLEMNLHHNLIGAWFESYSLAPPGQFDLTKLPLELLSTAMAGMLVLAMKIALPITAFLLLIDLALGILARVVPQLNVFIVGIPLKTAVGLGVLSVMVLALNPLVRQGAHEFFNYAGTLLKATGG
jgi:flagellar biosynthesis protein FliR